MLPGVDGCALCGILAGRPSASVVLRDDPCTAFLDVQPVNEGHVLIVPNDHAESLQDPPDRDGVAVFRVIRRVAAVLYESALRCEGVNLRLADGRVAGQEIFHGHLRVIPRFQVDGVGLVFGPGCDNAPNTSELEETARRLGELL